MTTKFTEERKASGGIPRSSSVFKHSRAHFVVSKQSSHSRKFSYVFPMRSLLCQSFISFIPNEQPSILPLYLLVISHDPCAEDYRGLLDCRQCQSSREIHVYPEHLRQWQAWSDEGLLLDLYLVSADPTKPLSSAKKATRFRKGLLVISEVCPVAKLFLCVRESRAWASTTMIRTEATIAAMD